MIGQKPCNLRTGHKFELLDKYLPYQSVHTASAGGPFTICMGNPQGRD